MPGLEIRWPFSPNQTRCVISSPSGSMSEQANSRPQIKGKIAPVVGVVSDTSIVDSEKPISGGSLNGTTPVRSIACTRASQAPFSDGCREPGVASVGSFVDVATHTTAEPLLATAVAKLAEPGVLSRKVEKGSETPSAETTLRNGRERLCEWAGYRLLIAGKHPRQSFTWPTTAARPPRRTVIAVGAPPPDSRAWKTSAAAPQASTDSVSRERTSR